MNECVCVCVCEREREREREERERVNECVCGGGGGGARPSHTITGLKQIKQEYFWRALTVAVRKGQGEQSVLTTPARQKWIEAIVA